MLPSPRGSFSSSSSFSSTGGLPNINRLELHAGEFGMQMNDQEMHQQEYPEYHVPGSATSFVVRGRLPQVTPPPAGDTSSASAGQVDMPLPPGHSPSPIAQLGMQNQQETPEQNRPGRRVPGSSTSSATHGHLPGLTSHPPGDTLSPTGQLGIQNVYETPQRDHPRPIPGSTASSVIRCYLDDVTPPVARTSFPTGQPAIRNVHQTPQEQLLLVHTPSPASAEDLDLQYRFAGHTPFPTATTQVDRQFLHPDYTPVPGSAEQLGGGTPPPWAYQQQPPSRFSDTTPSSGGGVLLPSSHTSSTVAAPSTMQNDQAMHQQLRHTPTGAGPLGMQDPPSTEHPLPLGGFSGTSPALSSGGVRLPSDSTSANHHASAFCTGSTTLEDPFLTPQPEETRQQNPPPPPRPRHVELDTEQFGMRHPHDVYGQLPSGQRRYPFMMDNPSEWTGPHNGYGQLLGGTAPTTGNPVQLPPPGGPHAAQQQQLGQYDTMNNATLPPTIEQHRGQQEDSRLGSNLQPVIQTLMGNLPRPEDIPPREDTWQRVHAIFGAPWVPVEKPNGAIRIMRPMIHSYDPWAPMYPPQITMAIRNFERGGFDVAIAARAYSQATQGCAVRREFSTAAVGAVVTAYGFAALARDGGGDDARAAVDCAIITAARLVLAGIGDARGDPSAATAADHAIHAANELTASADRSYLSAGWRGLTNFGSAATSSSSGAVSASAADYDTDGGAPVQQQAREPPAVSTGTHINQPITPIQQRQAGRFNVVRRNGAWCRVD
ncbi:hypothetical protein H2204_011964 [Knufia peltigerae]|uniref:Uncharacterized protein n=1 Tax=Knufia peltigerae TaxID=1002370 RepID=A0AA38XTB2_9EURO|nr:hypothetical protein H2204_011964 [Knufia peltigerae]